MIRDTIVIITVGYYNYGVPYHLRGSNNEIHGLLMNVVGTENSQQRAYYMRIYDHEAYRPIKKELHLINEIHGRTNYIDNITRYLSQPAVEIHTEAELDNEITRRRNRLFRLLIPWDLPRETSRAITWKCSCLDILTSVSASALGNLA